MTALRRAFTIVELLVVITIIAILLGLLLPAVFSASDGALVAKSEANLRTLGQGHATYASEWNGRQYTAALDDIVLYGLDDSGGGTATPTTAITGYRDRVGEWPKGIMLGHGPHNDGTERVWMFRFDNEDSQNYPLMAPYVFEQTDETKRNLGWYRLPNVKALHDYVGGRFYDEVYYAPKDDIVLDSVQQALDAPSEYIATYPQGGPDGIIEKIGYSSYSMSAAALFSPAVFRNSSQGGFQSPWSIAAGMKTPSFSQVQYSSLKTHMLEHHWLQGRKSPCNAALEDQHYAECEPWYFNQGKESRPVTLFYDGHVELISVDQAERADARHQVQAGFGLWSRDTPLGPDGYFSGAGYDDANTSFHLFTTDGVRGRDILSD